jgi:hypothetical protein
METPIEPWFGFAPEALLWSAEIGALEEPKTADDGKIAAQ